MALFEPGRKKTGGRQKGTKNKTLSLMEKAALLNIDPLTTLLLFSAGRWHELGYSSEKNRYGEPIISPELRATCASKAADFLYPKYKPRDFDDDEEKEDEVIHVLTEQQKSAVLRIAADARDRHSEDSDGE